MKPFSKSMYRPLKTALALSASILAASAAAQDLRKMEPAPVPPLATSPAPAPAAAPAPVGNRPLLAGLKGMVFIRSPEQLTQTPDLDARGIDYSRVPSLASQPLLSELSSYLDKPLGTADLQALLGQVTKHYADRDLPFVSVTAPEQDVTDGILRVLVVEARLGKVQVEGNRWFDEEQYLKAFGMKSGDNLRYSAINSGIDWIGRNPVRAASIVARPGAGFGETDFVLRVQERKPLRLYASSNNTGTETTDMERLAFGANWSNAFGYGHQLNAQITASPDFHKSKGLSASYILPLEWRHLFNVSAAWSRINADMPAGFDSEGQSWQLSFGYEVPLSPLMTDQGQLTHSFTVGADFKRSDNNLEFGGFPVTDNETDIVQAVGNYQVGLPDALGYTSFSTTVLYSPGDVTRRNDDESFEGSRQFAEANYSYGRLDLRRQTRLPADFSWNLLLAAQVADGNLLGSEQLGLSGFYGVRGYDNNALFTDEGVLLRNELYTPAWRKSDMALQPFLFYDYGRGGNEKRLIGEEEHSRINSAGLGAQFALGNILSLRFEYGWQQDNAPYESGHQRQGHFTLTVNY